MPEHRRFQRYDGYRKVNLDWIDSVPSGWEIRRLKQIGWLRAGVAFPYDFQGVQGEEIPFLKVADMNQRQNSIWMVDSANSVSRKTARSLGATIFARGSIAFPKVGAALLGNKRRLLSVPSCADNNIMVLTPKEGNPRYLRYLLGQLDFRKIANPGAVPSVNEGQVRDLPVPFPGTTEQDAVADFLDRETARIDALIEQKQRLVELLQEKRAALITQAVTKGLNPDVCMKDSGVEWLGNVPAEWELPILARCTISRCDGPFGSSLSSQHYSDVGVRVIRLQNIGFAEFCGGNEAYIGIEYYRELGEHDVWAGDLLIAGLGDERHPVGRACVAPPSIEPAMVKADCFRYRLNLDVLDPHFAAYQLSATARSAAGALSSGATRSRMNLTATSARRIALPPLDEQKRIVQFIEGETLQVNELVFSVEEASRLLREYRTALISAAVTGQIDVRESAA